MKKFLTFSVACLAGLVSFAGFCGNPAGKISAKEVAEKFSSTDSGIKFVQPRGEKEAEAQQEDETRAPLWNSIGYGHFKDCIMAPLFIASGYDMKPQMLEVEIEENAKVPGTYRLLNPYKSFDMSAIGDLSYDIMGDHHMIIHTETVDGKDYIWIEDFKTGLSIDGVGDVVLETQAAGLINIAQWTPEQILANIQDGMGTFDKEKGVMSYPTYLLGPYKNPETGVVTMEKMYNFLCYAGNGEQMYWGGNLAMSPFQVVMPDFEIPEDPNPFDVYTYYGEGTFNNNTFTTVFETPEVPEVTVEVYENPDNGRLILRRAWAIWADDETLDETPFTLEVSDPSCILVPAQPAGLSIMVDESGAMAPLYAMSNSYKFASDGKTMEDFFREAPETNIYLDLENKRIVFPPMSMCPCFLYNEYIYGMPMNESYAYESYLTLPDEYLNRFAGVEDIVGDQEFDGSVKYYNLQGVEVANPEKGQLVIKRQGSKTTKMIVR